MLLRCYLICSSRNRYYVLGEVVIINLIDWLSNNCNKIAANSRKKMKR